MAYFYTVKAVSPLASSVASNEATATVAVHTPRAADRPHRHPRRRPDRPDLDRRPPTPATPACTGYQIFRGTSAGGESGTPLTTVEPHDHLHRRHRHPRRGLLLHRQSPQPTAHRSASNEATATPLPLPPGAPTALTATPGVAQIALAWTAPSIAGNPAFTGYQIFRGTTPGGESGTALAPT